jgi:hypothetical protein
VNRVANPRRRQDLWFETLNDGRVIRRRRELDKLVARASRVASGSLPGFVAERYEIAIRLASAGDWSATAPLDIQLQPRDGSAPFGLEDAADGVQLWVHVAVLEAIRDLRRWPTKVQAAIQSLKLNVDEVIELTAERDRLEADLEELDPGTDDYAGADSERSVAVGELGIARQAAASFVHELDLALRGAFKLPRAGEAPHTIASLDRSQDLRPPLYVLDEPERHLHARLQRAAAQWLGVLAQVDDVQVVLRFVWG